LILRFFDGLIMLSGPGHGIGYRLKSDKFSK